MLSLNSLTDKAASLRPQDLKPRARAGEDHESRPDFQAYLATAVQQPKPEALQQVTPVKTESLANERVAAEQNTGRSANDVAPALSAQKAGHEAATTPAEAVRADEKPAKDAAEINPRSAALARSEKDLLEVLGLSAQKLKPAEKKPAVSTTQTLRSAKEATATQKTEGKGLVFKAEAATHTLTLLEKSPDLILMSSDGLRRLGEKLGLSLLGKVNDKLQERTQRSDSTQPQNGRGDNRPDLSLSMAPGRTQKTGAEERQGDSQSQHQQKSFRQSLTRSVSRETSSTEVAATLRQTTADPLVTVNPSNQDSTLQRSHSPTLQTADTRLSEAAASARTTDSIRAAVENPMLRPDLVRQFNEIISRAQVLVTDTQNAQFSVKLFPREIGRMEIDLKMVDGEIRGKIVVESEDVKNEMQNFLQNRDNQTSGEQFDMNRIDIEVRNGNQNAQNPQQAPETAELLQNLVTQSASAAYNAVEASSTQGNALYA